MAAVPHLTPGEYSASSLYFPQRGAALHALVTSCGYSRESTLAYDWHGLRRGRTEFVLLQYTMGGGGRLVYEGADFSVGPGQAMLLHFPHDNRYFLAQDPPFWEFIYVCLHGAEVMRLWTAAERREGPLFTFAPDSPVVELAARIISRAALHQIDTPWQSSSLAYQLTMALLDTLNVHGDAHPRPEPIERVVRFCRENVGQALTVDDMAGVAGMSRFHFTRVFTQSEGVSPGEYVRELRVRRAAHLLQTTSMGVKQIAEDLGFYDATYFCKTFKKVIGTTPRVFRDSGMYGRGAG